MSPSLVDFVGGANTSPKVVTKEGRFPLKQQIDIAVIEYMDVGDERLE